MAPYPFLRPPTHPDDLGTLGGYRVIRLLGNGAMGFVFLAEDSSGLDRRQALKVMRPEFSMIPGGRERFLREAKAAAKVTSDHVVTIFLVGEDNGAPYIAMELLEGMSLENWLAHRDRLPSIRSAFKVARDLFRGLKDAHAHGLIHRDIKPSNLWIEKRSGRIKILDFGLTKAGDGSDNATRSGAILGTPAYMAPEQANGLPVDLQADLFSAGLVLHEVLTGKNPFRRGNILATLNAIGREEAPSVLGVRPETPAALVALVDSLLAKDPKGRPVSAQETLQKLAVAEQEFVAQSGKTTHPTGEPSSGPEPDRGNREDKAEGADGSDPGSFLFETGLLFTRPEKPRPAMAQKKNAAAWLIGLAVFGAVALSGLGLYFTKNWNGSAGGPTPRPVTPSLEVQPDKRVSAEKPSVPGPGAGANPNPIPEPPAQGNSPAGISLVTRIGKALVEKNPGIKLPEILPAGDKKWSIQIDGKGLVDLSPLAGLDGLVALIVSGPSNITDLGPLRGKPLEKILICQSPLADLAPLQGMPLHTVHLNNNQIVSLEPLRGAPLVHVELSGNPGLASLGPLREAPLQDLRINRTRVTSLEPLKGKAISFLEFADCAIPDLAPLQGMPLATVFLGPGAINLGILQGMPLVAASGIPVPCDPALLKSWAKIQKVNGKEPTDPTLFARMESVKPLPATPAKPVDSSARIEKKPKPDLDLEGHRYELTRVEFCADGKQVASAGLSAWDGNKDTIRIWNAAEGSPRKSIEIFESNKVMVAFSSDLKRVAMGGHLKFSAWNLETNLKLFESDQNLGGVGGSHGLAFSPDGKLLVGGESGSFQVVETLRWAVRLRWDAKSLYPNPEGLIAGNFCFNRDGKFLLFSVGKNQDLPTEIHLMDIQSRRLLRTFKGHTHGVCLAFSPNSRYVASGSRDRSIQIWDVQKQLPTPKPVKVLGKGEILPVHAIAWSPDGKLIAAGDIEGNITFFEGSEANGFAEIPALRLASAHQGGVGTLDFSPDSKRLVTGGADKKVRVWTLPIQEKPN